jgi:hypothetical protein
LVLAFFFFFFFFFQAGGSFNLAVRFTHNADNSSAAVEKRFALQTIGSGGPHACTLTPLTDLDAALLTGAIAVDARFESRAYYNKRAQLLSVSGFFFLFLGSWFCPAEPSLILKYLPANSLESPASRTG